MKKVSEMKLVPISVVLIDKTQSKTVNSKTLKSKLKW